MVAKNLNWDEWFFLMAQTVALKSKDRSTQVGCVVIGPDQEVRSVGYNGFPRGADDSREDWHERPKKYLVTAHAELNAVANAARIGARLKGCTAYVTLPPCARCAVVLVQAGISVVKFLAPPEGWEGDNRWKEEFGQASEIFRTCGVQAVEFASDTGSLSRRSV
jgi:dCMP deaminase